MKMSPEMFARYDKNPMGMDEEVRRHFKIPSDKYYSVSVMNEIGAVHITPKLVRHVTAKKISKSDQP